MVKMEFYEVRALVTASTSGIGLGIAQALVDVGARVAIHGRDPGRLERAVTELRARGGERMGERVVGLQGDLVERDVPERLVSQATQLLDGPVELLVCNAGGPRVEETFALSEDDWHLALEQNLMSGIRLCRALTLRLLAPRPAPQHPPDSMVYGKKPDSYGRILFIGSTTAREPEPRMALSSVTRAGLLAYAKTIAYALAPHNITVNTLLVGACMTDRVRRLHSPEELRTAERLIPAHYIPTPAELAQVALWLLSPAARFVTGQALGFDGGLLRSL